MKILWLASWYPNAESPFDGDFVQRHARAVSLFVPVTVFFVSQAGPASLIKESKIKETIQGNLIEKIVTFSFLRTGISFLDKLIYNWRYYYVYRKLIKKYINEEGIPDLVHVHIPVKAGAIASWMKKKWHIPFIVTEHSAHYVSHSADSYFKRSHYHKRLTEKIFREAAMVTTVSKEIGSIMQRVFSLHSVKITRNVADNNLFFNEGRRGGTNSCFRFIHVSTLKENQKNISGMLRGIRILSEKRTDFIFIIVGPFTDVLKHKVKELNLEAVVQFAGEISYSQVASQMRHADALVLFSRYENFPCVIVEALCCGLPVIATGVGGIREALDESNGIIIEPDDEEGLATAMSRMIEIYASFSRTGIATAASDRYSYEAIGTQFYKCYQELVFSKQE